MIEFELFRILLLPFNEPDQQRQLFLDTLFRLNSFRLIARLYQLFEIKILHRVLSLWVIL